MQLRNCLASQMEVKVTRDKMAIWRRLKSSPDSCTMREDNDLAAADLATNVRNGYNKGRLQQLKEVIVIEAVEPG
jgi:hypothetical protein